MDDDPLGGGTGVVFGDRGGGGGGFGDIPPPGVLPGLDFNLGVAKVGVVGGEGSAGLASFVTRFDLNSPSVLGFLLGGGGGGLMLLVEVSSLSV